MAESIESYTQRWIANALARGAEGARQGFGEREIGIPVEIRARYPGLSIWQPLAAPADLAMRAWPSFSVAEPAFWVACIKTWVPLKQNHESCSES